MFCQQDRAILCRECDYPIHAANEHTQKHNRYLLTGVKLSATSALYRSSSSNAVSDSVSDPKSTSTQSSSITKSVSSVSPPIPNPPNSLPKNSTSSTATTTTTTINDDCTGLTSSISEYLIETLPGWHVEDFLNSSSVAFGFRQCTCFSLYPSLYFLFKN